MDRILSLKKMCFAVLYDNIVLYKHVASQSNFPDCASLSILNHMDIDLCCVQAYTRRSILKICLERFPSFDEYDLKNQCEFLTLQDRLIVKYCRSGRNILSQWSNIPRNQVAKDIEFTSFELSIM